MIENYKNHIKPLKIGNVTVPNNLFLAPLAGFTDMAFRKICKECGAGLTVTEMVSVKGLCYNNQNTEKLLKIDESEKPSCVQLFGSEREFFLQALKREEIQKFDIIDINLGCPMPKIVKNGDGSALASDIKKTADIVEALAKTGKTVTAKIRLAPFISGEQRGKEKRNAVQIATALENSGAMAITVHGRTASQGYSGKADWSAIGEVAVAVKIPVIGNGDILTESDVSEKLRDYAVAGVMIGRGAVGNPHIFSLQSTKTDKKILLRTVLQHIDYSLAFFQERYTMVNMRKHLSAYFKGVSGLRELKQKINTINDIESLRTEIKNSFAKIMQN